MSCSWSSHSGSFSMPSSKLTLAEVMDNGFVANQSSYVHSTPFHSYVEGNSAVGKGDRSRSASLYMPSPNQTLMEMLENCFLAEMPDSTSFHSYCVEGSSALKMFVVAESTKLTGGDEMQRGFGASNNLASICKTPVAPYSQIFDLSSLVSEQNGRFNNSVVDLFYDKISSTPCKNPAPVEHQPSKSLETSEVLMDLPETQKPTPLVWEISEIDLPLDNTLSLDTSVEEWRSPSGMVVEHDTTKLSLERSSLASAMSFHWAGVRPRKTSSLDFKSFAYETQIRPSESVASLTSSRHVKPFDFAIPSPDDGFHDKRYTAV